MQQFRIEIITRDSLLVRPQAHVTFSLVWASEKLMVLYNSISGAAGVFNQPSSGKREYEFESVSFICYLYYS